MKISDNMLKQTNYGVYVAPELSKMYFCAATRIMTTSAGLEDLTEITGEWEEGL